MHTYVSQHARSKYIPMRLLTKSRGKNSLDATTFPSRLGGGTFAAWGPTGLVDIDRCRKAGSTS